ncbi:hypothetical protein EIMP300_87750 [Escherichia coli]|uniref:Adaptive response protein AidB N-terminal domain-containing protein n=1 Tax=Escherichia coli TaxID=562 RepID=A0A8S0G2G4_ECOLX|nr:hypothetical protein EIMP300_87750 [Escherichia coli]
MHWQTHTVFNQPIPLNNSNLYLSDGALCEAVTREGAGWDSDFLASIGQQLGTAESLELGRLANVNPPELLRYDAQGRRLDDVRQVQVFNIFSPRLAPADAGAMYQSGAQSCLGRRRSLRRICGARGAFYVTCAG